MHTTITKKIRSTENKCTIKIKNCLTYLQPISLFLVVAKIGSKLSVSKFARESLNSFKVLSLVSLFVNLFQWSFLINSFLDLEE